MLCYKCGSHVPEGLKSCPTCGQSLARPTVEGPAKAASLVDDKRRQRTASRTGAAMLSTGDVLAGRYRVIDPIGAGGVGAVYRAHDQDIDVDVALKAIAPKLLQTAEEQKNFSQKIRLARKLHHANIVRIYDDGREGEQRFFTMQLLEGLTLRKVIDLRRQKLQPFVAQEIEPIFQQLTTALSFAHRTTYHGDLKPENIVILPDLLKLTDFCLIQALPLKPFLAIQKSRGKPFSYIAPEVRLEASRIDGRADVFSLGVILAEMLAGEVFSGTFDRQFNAAMASLPRRVDALIRRALAETPEARFQSVDDLWEALADILAAGGLDGIGAHPASIAPKPPPPPPAEEYEAPEPVYVSGSNVMLIEEGTAVERSDPLRDITSPDSTPIDRPPAIEPSAEERERHAVVSRPPLTPPPLPADAEEEDLAEARHAGEALPVAAKPSTLAEEIRRVTGESSDVYERATRLEQEGDVPSRGGNGAGRVASPAPPPLPADAVEAIGGPEPTISEPSSEAVGIHDELTAISRYPEPPPGRRDRALSPALPSGLPPPIAPVVPALRRRKSSAAFYVGAAIGIVVICVFAYGVYQLRHPMSLIERQRLAQMAGRQSSDAGGQAHRFDAAAVAQTPAGHDAAAALAAPDAAAVAIVPDKPDAAPIAAPPPVRDAGPSPAELARLEAERRATTESNRASAEHAARLDREQATRALEERRAREEERRRQREEAQRLAEEARKQRELERQRELEEKRAAEQERRAAEARAIEEAARAKQAAAEKAKELQVAARTPEAAAGQKCPRGMALIPAGAFQMGSAPNDPMRNFEERRLESVDVSGFCIDYYEYPNGKTAPPKVGVTWFQAKALCEARGKRLCSEEEWEKACKGPRNARFPYGNAWDPVICNTEDAEGNDHPLDVAVNFARCRSGYGIINMSGNAAEWTSSSFSPGMKDRVHKGGAANRPNWAARCANRGNLAPSEQGELLGFRCCSDPQ
ncbi:MAG: SUMF1/EgtB/PvdO family nonheme iron enzyme [Deltaproteobacteria bacterium]|nr:SUMF1/EgtB/PvdO family nonheme iron enzyme [Deltaproteobacteria bacterium]